MGVDLSKLTNENNKNKDASAQINIFDDSTKKEKLRVSLLLSEYYSCFNAEKKKELRQKISDTINKQLEIQEYNSAILEELKKNQHC